MVSLDLTIMAAEDVFDLCIIGAGMFGSAAARHASADPSLKVCLLGTAEPTLEERPNREIFASHYDEGRITRVVDDQVACQVLAKHSIERHGELEKLSGINFHTPVGCLFMGERNGKFMQNIIQVADPCKVPLVDLSKSEALHRRYPFLKLNSDECAILEDSGAGHISPRKLVQAQKKVAELQGCCIINDVACGVKTSPNGVHVVCTEKGQDISSRRLLIATGAFVNLKDLQPLKSLAVKRWKETVVLLRIPENELNRLSSLPDMIVARKYSNLSSSEIGFYILPPIKYPDGNYYLKFGDLFLDENCCETLEEVKDWYLSAGNDEIIKTHLPLVTDLLPGLQYTDISKLTCVTCHTPSGLPYIDRVSPTVTVAVGGNGKGAKFSDETGRIAAKLSVTGQWDSELNQNQFRAIFE